uniref:Uncharacterized protein n=1 Tax=Anguilla anguilla TaxID=7936 RepID=A0A0E9PTU1_ANGAN
MCAKFPLKTKIMYREKRSHSDL